MFFVRPNFLQTQDNGSGNRINRIKIVCNIMHIHVYNVKNNIHTRNHVKSVDGTIKNDDDDAIQSVCGRSNDRTEGNK